MRDQSKVAAGRRWAIPALVIASFGAFIPGYLNTHVTPMNDYMSVEAIVAICLISTLAGALCPRLAWVSALMIGLGLPAFHLAVQLFGVSVPRPLPLHLGDLFALIPALICTGAGAGWRLFMSHPITKGP